MNNLSNILIGLGSILIVSSCLYLFFNLNDRSAELALPVMLAGVVIIFMNAFMWIWNPDNKNVLMHVKRSIR